MMKAHDMVYGVNSEAGQTNFWFEYNQYMPDPVALDQACIDLIYSAEGRESLVN
ncbi:MAG: hypothetical protein ABGU93_12590 [Acetobacterium sp.]|uniref:hypothetical protein n=1 Tax=Acetobacterium sp. TaxID=1872094 RepID=UPI0032429C86